MNTLSEIIGVKTRRVGYRQNGHYSLIAKKYEIYRKSYAADVNKLRIGSN